MSENQDITLPLPDELKASSNLFNLGGNPLPDIPSINSVLDEQLALPKLEGIDESQQYTPTVDDPDSWLSGVGRSFNEIQKGIAFTAQMVGRKYNIPELEEWGIKDEMEQQKDIEYYGTPSRTASFTDGLKNIQESYGDEEDLGAALRTGLLLAKDMSAKAVGSFGPVAAAIVPGVAIAAAGAPVVGGIATLTLPLLASFAVNSGPTYQEAKDAGAAEEEAQKAGIYGGSVMAILDRIGLSFVIGSFVKQYGKNAVTDEIAREVGESKARKIVETAMKVQAGGLKAGVAESIIESSQETVQMIAVGQAIDSPDLFPYNDEVTKKRLVDAAALGFVGGQTIGTPATFASLKMRKDLTTAVEKLENDLVELRKGQEDFDNNVSQRGIYQGRLTEDKPMEGARILSGLIKGPVSALSNLGNRSNSGARIVDSLLRFPNAVSSETGKDAQQLQATFDKLRRSIKLPFVQRAIPKKVSQEIFEVITEGKQPSSRNIEAAANEIKEFLGTVELDPTTGKAAKPVVLEKKDLVSSIINDKIVSKVQKALDSGRITREEYNNIESSIEPMRLEYMNRVQQSPDEAKSILRDIKNSKEFKNLTNTVVSMPESTGFFKKLQDAGIELDFVEGYLPTIYKTGPLARRKMSKILQKEFGFSNLDAETTVDKIEGNEGVMSMDDIQIDVESMSPRRATEAELAAANRRTLSPAIRKKLREEGLVETDIEGILYKYILDANKKIASKNLANTLNTEMNNLKKVGDAAAGGINPAEIRQIQKIFDATQNRYGALDDKNVKSLQKWFLTSQYILTLPLVALTAISEPLIILTRTDPKYALFGASKALYNSFKNGARKVFPKLPRSKSEEAFASILQGLDGTLSERFGDLAGVTASKKITNAFFRATMLTTVTQISRDMAFQAARMQMRNDLKIINRFDRGNRRKTREYFNAKKRLMQQGILNPNAENVQDWALHPSSEIDPDIIRQSLSKTVDEFIMSPNAVNRPLWMSNPHFAMVAQLKGFLATFGNIVGGRMWKEIGVPLTKQVTGQEGGRIPAGEMARATIALTTIVAVAMFIQGIKDSIRYGEEESPFDKLEGSDQIFEALRRTNILGTGTVAFDALNAQKYGSNFWEVILGPGASQIANVGGAGFSYLFNDKPRQLSKEIANAIPILRQIPMVRDSKSDIVNNIETFLEDLRDKVVD